MFDVIDLARGEVRGCSPSTSRARGRATPIPPKRARSRSYSSRSAGSISAATHGTAGLDALDLDGELSLGSRVLGAPPCLGLEGAILVAELRGSASRGSEPP